MLRNPVKLYPENTNLIYASYLPQIQDSTIGKVRETFFINQLQNAGIPVYYSKVGDFKIDHRLIEVGGKNKTGQQIQDVSNAYIAADNILVGSKNTIPLYLFGFLS